MMVVVFMTVLNPVMNCSLIFGHFLAPAMGATGAAIGTALSLSIGVVVNCVLVRSCFPNDGFLSMMPGRPLLLRISQLSLPINITRFFLGAGYVIFLRFMGEVGTAELAATSVLVRATMVLDIMSTSLGMAAATLVSRTVGE